MSFIFPQLARLNSKELQLGTINRQPQEPTSAFFPFPTQVFPSPINGKSREIWSTTNSTATRCRENCTATTVSLLRPHKSLEALPRDIKEHILKCQCSCDHLGYGNFSVSYEKYWIYWILFNKRVHSFLERLRYRFV